MRCWRSCKRLTWTFGQKLWRTTSCIPELPLLGKSGGSWKFHSREETAKKNPDAFRTHAAIRPHRRPYYACGQNCFPCPGVTRSSLPGRHTVVTGGHAGFHDFTIVDLLMQKGVVPHPTQKKQCDDRAPCGDRTMFKIAHS